MPPKKTTDFDYRYTVLNQGTNSSSVADGQAKQQTSATSCAPQQELVNQQHCDEVMGVNGTHK